MPFHSRVQRSRWHVAYHGTTVSALDGILSSGALAPPGREVVTGAAATACVAVREGHIPAPFERFNPHTKRRETFDPNQVRRTSVVFSCRWRSTMRLLNIAPRCPLMRARVCCADISYSYN